MKEKLFLVQLRVKATTITDTGRKHYAGFYRAENKEEVRDKVLSEGMAHYGVVLTENNYEILIAEENKLIQVN